MNRQFETENLGAKLGRLKKKCAIFWMWQSWPMIYNTGGLWCATRWFADQMCSWGKKKCTAQLNLPTINNLFLTQLLSEATREQALFLWLDESCMCFERSEATLCLYPRWMNSITKHCQRPNGPESWVHITSSNTNLHQISSSEYQPSINFKISTKHQHFH